MCGVWREYDVAGIGGGEFTLRLTPRQKVAPLYWRSDTHTHTSRTERPIALGQVWRTTTFAIFCYKYIYPKYGEVGHVANSLCPEKSCPKHLLLVLYFLKVYLKQSLGCLVVGASTGAVNPKTMRKWVCNLFKKILIVQTRW